MNDHILITMRAMGGLFGGNKEMIEKYSFKIEHPDPEVRESIWKLSEYNGGIHCTERYHVGETLIFLNCYNISYLWAGFQDSLAKWMIKCKGKYAREFIDAFQNGTGPPVTDPDTLTIIEHFRKQSLLKEDVWNDLDDSD